MDTKSSNKEKRWNNKEIKKFLLKMNMYKQKVKKGEIIPRAPVKPYASYMKLEKTPYLFYEALHGINFCSVFPTHLYLGPGPASTQRIHNRFQFGCCLVRSISYVKITLSQRILDTLYICKSLWQRIFQRFYVTYGYGLDSNVKIQT